MRQRNPTEQHRNHPRKPRQLTRQIANIPRQKYQPHFRHTLIPHQKPRMLKHQRQENRKHKPNQYRHQYHHKKRRENHKRSIPVKHELVGVVVDEALDGFVQDDGDGVFEQALAEDYGEDFGLVLGFYLGEGGDVVDAAHAGGEQEDLPGLEVADVAEVRGVAD